MVRQPTRRSRIHVTVLALLAWCFYPSPARSQEPATLAAIAPQSSPDPIVATAVFIGGVARGQTVRISLANLVRPEGRERHPVDVSGRVLLYDGQGIVIAQADVPVIPAGWMQAFDFRRDAIALPGEPGTGRIQVRALVEVRCTGVSRRDAGPLQKTIAKLLPASVEVFDSGSGRSQTGVSVLEFAVENFPNN